MSYVLECLVSTYYNLIHSRLLYVLEYLLYIIGAGDLATLAVAPIPTKHCAKITSEWSAATNDGDWTPETRGAHSKSV
jgi:hypothetical protein